MMSQEAISVPSNNLRDPSVQLHEPNSNSNSNPNNPNPNSLKRKRSLPGTPGKLFNSFISECRSDCSVAKVADGDQPIHLRSVQQGFPEGPEPAAAPARAQLTVEAAAEKQGRGGEEEGVQKSCVHHDPCRALGDLTGIKKHFSRKHGEKKWKCDKCSKKYAVQSDWKAHNKICGTRQYKCDCGTIFSRKDSFVTHGAFCDAMAEQNARLPAVLSNLGSEILMNAAQGPRVMPQALQLHGFHNSEFGGPGSEPYMGNFADVNHVEHNKLRMPLWLDQTNNIPLQLNHHHHHHPLSVSSNNSSSLFSPGTTLAEANNMFGTSSSSQGQWLNYRYHPEASFTHANVSIPHGLKLEQEENKGDLSHSVSSLYQSHMEPTRMSGGNNNLAFDNSNFGLLDPNMSSTSSNNNNRYNNNVVEIQKLFKQGNQAVENFNHMVNSQASTNNIIGGGFSLSSTKGLEHMVMPRIEEWESGEPEIMQKQQLRSSTSNATEEHLTKDFMGIGPVINLQSQFRGHY
ncbi:Protein indeterminate-domain 9 [Glycine soja]